MPKIREKKGTCAACGNVWFWGKQDELEAGADAAANCGKSMMCCSGCLPAVLIPDKKVQDFGKCPKCGARAIRVEVVEHNV